MTTTKCDTLGSQNILWPVLHIFRGSRPPNPQDLRPLITTCPRSLAVGRMSVEAVTCLSVASVILCQLNTGESLRCSQVRCVRVQSAVSTVITGNGAASLTPVGATVMRRPAVAPAAASTPLLPVTYLAAFIPSISPTPYELQPNSNYFL